MINTFSAHIQAPVFGQQPLITTDSGSEVRAGSPGAGRMVEIKHSKENRRGV